MVPATQGLTAPAPPSPW